MALESLEPGEAVGVLTGLLREHPELTAEAERLAVAVIAPQPRERIAESVTKVLSGLDIHDLAERAGTHRGRYVEPQTAARELVDEALEPYLADVRRLAGFGRVAEAHEVAVGVLVGLHACGDVAGHEVLGYVELPEWADVVSRRLERLRIPMPDEAYAEACPRWR